MRACVCCLRRVEGKARAGERERGREGEREDRWAGATDGVDRSEMETPRPRKAEGRGGYGWVDFMATSMLNSPSGQRSLSSLCWRARRDRDSGIGRRGMEGGC
eukprot:1016985-Rhodomonas_salina.2